jgi:hypothetical protein
MEGIPIELSYHGNSHYNSIIIGNRPIEKNFGAMETKALKR